MGEIAHADSAFTPHGSMSRFGQIEVQVAAEASRVCRQAARVRPRALDAENDLVK
jgi:hypothetical protein